MSRRATDFLLRWMAENLPNRVTDDPGAITDLADQAMNAAQREGIPVRDIRHEVGSVFEVILDAMRNRAAGRLAG